MLTLILAALADPCGMVPPAWVGPGEGIQRVGDQQTYVFFDKGIETIAIRPGFSGTVDEFGMLVPIPSPPALRKISDETFAHLAALVDPPAVQVHIYDPYAFDDMSMAEESSKMERSVAMPSAAPPPEDVVVVINQEAMGMYEVAVLEAGSPKALERWMTEHRYKYPDGMDDVVGEYVAARWLFVAVKTKVGQSAGVEPRPGMRSTTPGLPKGAAFTGEVQGMAFRFKVDAPVVPMRLSTFNGEAASNIVYMVSDRPVRIDDRPTSLVRRQVGGADLFRQATELLPVLYQNGTAEEVPEHHKAQIEQMRAPQPHLGVARDLLASDALAVQTKELSLPFEREEKELLNINEVLNLRGAGLDSQVDHAMQEQRQVELQSTLPQLENYTVTVFDGDFGRDWLRSNNLRFSGWSMAADDNSPTKWRRSPQVIQSISVERVASRNPPAPPRSPGAAPEPAPEWWWPF